MKKRFGNYLSDRLQGNPLRPQQLPPTVQKHIAQLLPESQWSLTLREQKRQREIVAGGDVLYKPIDKTARLVVAPAPWWAKLDPSLCKPQHQNHHQIKHHRRKQPFAISCSPDAHPSAQTNTRSHGPQIVGHSVVATMPEPFLHSVNIMRPVRAALRKKLGPRSPNVFQNFDSEPNWRVLREKFLTPR